MPLALMMCAYHAASYCHSPEICALVCEQHQLICRHESWSIHQCQAGGLASIKVSNLTLDQILSIEHTLLEQV